MLKPLYVGIKETWPLGEELHVSIIYTDRQTPENYCNPLPQVNMCNYVTNSVTLYSVCYSMCLVIVRRGSRAITSLAHHYTVM